MKFKSIKIQNFRSFQGKHEFDFWGSPSGLNDVRGRNGAGKSTMFEAVFWALYGKTTRNLKAVNVQNWETKGKVECELVFEINGSDYVITRSWAPIALKINGIDVDQSSVDNLVRLSSDAFQHAIYISQFATTFFDLAPTPKLAVFSKILNLDVWLNRSIRAREVSEKHKAEVIKLDGNLKSLDGKAEQLAQQIDTYNQKALDFEADQVKEINLYRQQLERHQIAHTVAKDRVTALEDRIGDVNTKCDVAKEELKHQLSVKVELDELLAEIQDQARECKTMLRVAKEDLANYQQVGDDCSECLQKVSAKHRKTVMKQFEDTVKQRQEDLDKIVPQLDEITSLYGDINKDISKSNNNIRLLEAELSKIQSDIKMTKSSITQQNQDIIRIENLILSAQQKENPFETLLAKVDEQADRIADEYEAVNKEREVALVKQEHANFWVNGFKEIRLFVLEQALTTLEVEINNYLAELGLLGWSISFDVERETKSGTVSKGFITNITSPLTENPVPWEAWSGGELQRLRVAGALGIANIIRRYAGLTDAPLIIDEPTKHMDSYDDLLTTLDRIASTEQIPIWFIDHNTHEYGGFSSITNVEKTEHGTKITRAA